MKNGQFRKERKCKKIYNYKRYWLKFENLIKEDNLLELEDIKKVLKKRIIS